MCRCIDCIYAKDEREATERQIRDIRRNYNYIDKELLIYKITCLSSKVDFKGTSLDKKEFWSRVEWSCNGYEKKDFVYLMKESIQKGEINDNVG